MIQESTPGDVRAARAAAESGADPAEAELVRLRALVSVLTSTVEDSAGVAARNTLRMLQAAADAAPDLIYVKDLTGKYLFLNAAAARVKGAPADEVIGRDDRDFFDPEFAARLMATDREVIASETVREVEEASVVDGVQRTFLSLRAPYRDESGRVVGLIGISRDMTDARRAAAQLARAEARWQFAVDCAGDGIWDWDLVTDRVFYSPGWKSMLGYAEDEVGEGTGEWQDRVHPDDLPAALEALNLHLRPDQNEFSSDHRMRTRSGDWLWIRCRARVIERDAAGTATRLVGVLTDIAAEVAERHRAERAALELRRLAETDELAGIANRRGFNRGLIAAWEYAREHGVAVHLALIDVDRFKAYNDGRGHAAGDRALQALARVVARVPAGGADLAARYGGDEFALLLTGDVDLGAVLEAVRAEMLARGLADADGRPLTVSCGGASAVPSSTTPGRLLREADRRLYEAKAAGRNRVVVP